MKYLLLICSLLFLWSCTDESRCNDGVLNGNETMIDCGGNCPPCFSCEDGVLNQGENAIDCGGPCPPCGDLTYWETVDLPVGKALNIHFYADKEGVYLNENGLWKTTDAGDSWTQLDPPVSSSFFSYYWLKVVDKDLAFLLMQSDQARYRLYRLEDEFSIWTSMAENRPSDFGEERAVYDVAATDADHILLAHEPTFGLAALSESTDGGQSWATLLTSTEFYPFNVDYLTSVYYRPGGNIYCSYEDDMLVSTDGGENWTMRAFPTPVQVSYPNLNVTDFGTLHFRNDTEGIFRRSSFGSAIWQTRDGGQSWEELAIPDVQYNEWYALDISYAEDGRSYVTTTQSCLLLNEGVCTIFWQRGATAEAWQNLGSTTGLDDPMWSDGVFPVAPMVFPTRAYALDVRGGGFEPRLLRLVR